MVQERHHFYREMNLDHLVRPSGPVPTAAQVRVVKKPGAEKLPVCERWGRLICDDRGIDQATRKELVEAENMNKMIDFIAPKLWTSLLDLLWGFNHMILTQRASDLLSIITSLGFLSPTVMQFGMHNGPTNMQSTVRKVFRRLRETFRASLMIALSVLVMRMIPRFRTLVT